MKRQNLVACLLVLVLAAGGAYAKPTTPTTPAAPVSAVLSESQLVEHKHYMSKDGNVVHSPAHTVDSKLPPCANARCGDGSYSFSRHHRGTCLLGPKPGLTQGADFHVTGPGPLAASPLAGLQ